MMITFWLLCDLIRITLIVGSLLELAQIRHCTWFCDWEEGLAKGAHVVMLQSLWNWPKSTTKINWFVESKNLIKPTKTRWSNVHSLIHVLRDKLSMTNISMSRNLPSLIFVVCTTLYPSYVSIFCFLGKCHEVHLLNMQVVRTSLVIFNMCKHYLTRPVIAS